MDKVTQGERDQNFKESLIQRDQERKEKLKILKEERESLFPNETKIFETTFDNQTKKIIDIIKLIEEKGVNHTNLPESLNSVKEEINSLSKYLAVSSKFLTNHTVKRSLESVENYESKLKDLEEKLLPKKKFAFKAAKKKNTDIKPAVSTENNKVNTLISRDDVDSVANKILSLSVISCGFSDKVNENLKLCDDEIAKRDVELKNLDNCIIFLCGNPSTVHISNITRCKIFSGPVSTSVFIENCTGSDLVMACQQLRIHSTTDTRFYTHITSRVIIEDTKNIQLAPYNLEYEGLSVHFDNSGLRRSPNNWNLVDDFNWLASDTPSPNWKEISEDERVMTWTPFLEKL